MNTRSYKREVYASFQMIGMHRWPDAPLGVKYLRDSHRHAFHIKIWKPVSHNDRHIEFQLLGAVASDWLRNQFGDHVSGIAELDTASCEDLAQMLMDKFELSKCEVSEDGENGAILEATDFYE